MLTHCNRICLLSNFCKNIDDLTKRALFKFKKKAGKFDHKYFPEKYKVNEAWAASLHLDGRMVAHGAQPDLRSCQCSLSFWVPTGYCWSAETSQIVVLSIKISKCPICYEQVGIDESKIYGLTNIVSNKGKWISLLSVKERGFPRELWVNTNRSIATICGLEYNVAKMNISEADYTGQDDGASSSFGWTVQDSETGPPWLLVSCWESGRLVLLSVTLFACLLKN